MKISVSSIRKFHKLLLLFFITIPCPCFSAQDDVNQKLIRAAILNSKEEIVELLKDPSIDVNKKGKNGYTPLMLASSRFNIQVVKLLLDNGADVNVKGKNGNTALFIASLYKDNEQVVTLLLDYDADINIKNNFGETVLTWPTYWNVKKMVELLNKYINEYLPYRAKIKKEISSLLPNHLPNISNIALGYYGYIKFSEFLNLAPLKPPTK